MSWWEIVLAVIFGLAALIFLLLMVRGRVIIEYSKDLKVYLKILFFRFTLVPKTKGRLVPADYRIDKLRKKKKRDEQKAAKKPKGTGKSKKKKGVSFTDLPKLIGFIKDIAGTLVGTFMGDLRIDVTRIRIAVATGDAAKTAITYGAVSHGVAALLTVLDGITNVKYGAKSEVAVYPDFLSDRFSADIMISFSLRGVHLLHVLFKTAFSYLKTKGANKLGI